MGEKNTGGLAFPVIRCADREVMSRGMDLRDYFAAKAMCAMIIGNRADWCVCSESGAIGMSKDAYIVADAMIAERDK